MGQILQPLPKGDGPKKIMSVLSEEEKAELSAVLARIKKCGGQPSAAHKKAVRDCRSLDLSDLFLL